jgi:hypothetical protein
MADHREVIDLIKSERSTVIAERLSDVFIEIDLLPITRGDEVGEHHKTTLNIDPPARHKA